MAMPEVRSEIYELVARWHFDVIAKGVFRVLAIVLE